MKPLASDPAARYAAGIDAGSAFCKAALLCAKGAGNTGITNVFDVSRVSIEKLFALPSGWNPRETGALALDALFAALPPDAIRPVPLVATGYGRERINEIEAKGITNTMTITEISAHAAGAEFLSPGVKTLIDIGGQDCKVITLEAGKARGFLMNDKCAAGSGRFLEAVAGRLGADSPLMIETLLGAGKSVALNSTCVVFAESEIIALIAQGVSREELLGGVAFALATRIGALAARLSPAEPAFLSGGLSESAGMAKALSQTLGITVRPLARGFYAGAIGAALKGF